MEALASRRDPLCRDAADKCGALSHTVIHASLDHDYDLSVFFLSPPLYVSYPTQSLFYDFVFDKQVVLELKKKNIQDLNLYCHISAITEKAFSDMDGRTCVFFFFS